MWHSPGEAVLNKDLAPGLLMLRQNLPLTIMWMALSERSLPHTCIQCRELPSMLSFGLTRRHSSRACCLCSFGLQPGTCLGRGEDGKEGLWGCWWWPEKFVFGQSHPVLLSLVAKFPSLTMHLSSGRGWDLELQGHSPPQLLSSITAWDSDSIKASNLVRHHLVY